MHGVAELSGKGKRRFQDQLLASCERALEQQLHFPSATPRGGLCKIQKPSRLQRTGSWFLLHRIEIVAFPVRPVTNL